MLKVCPEVYFEVSPTVSILNIFNISNLHQELVSLKLLDVNNIYLNFLERPKEYNLKSLSNDEKKEVEKVISNHIKWLSTNNTSANIISQFKSIASYLTEK